MLPLLINATATIVSALIDRSAASTVGEGAISVLSYGEGIQSRLLVLLFLPVAAVVYPYLAEAQREDDFNERFAFATRFALALLVPAAVFTGFFSELAVDILLRRGAFTLDQTLAVAPVLTVFMAGLVPYAISLLAVRGVLVRGRLWQLSALSVAVVLVKAATVPWFARQWGVEGIAAFSALSSLVVLAATLRFMFGSLAAMRAWLAAVLPYAARIAVAVTVAITAALIVDAVTPFTGELLAGPGWAPPGLRALTAEFVRLAIAGVLFLAIVGLAYQWLGVVTVRQVLRGLQDSPAD
jgi:putative peptidoglycan lipid II flippase